jgi:DNA-binding Xre family transcriptional regulator
MERDPVTLVLADNIERLMRDKGMNPAELRRAAGLNQSAIHDIFTGRSKSPKVETVAKIAAALQVNVADLFLDPKVLQARKAILAAFDSLQPAERDRLVLTARAWAAQTDKH